MTSRLSVRKEAASGYLKGLSGDSSAYSKDKSELKYSRHRDITQVWYL